MTNSFILSNINSSLVTSSSSGSSMTITVVHPASILSSMSLPPSLNKESTGTTGTTNNILQQPPNVKYDYENVSSSSTSNSPTINYSPKHSRRPSSLNSNRNMKNLSLNLHSSNSSTSSNSSSPSKLGNSVKKILLSNPDNSLTSTTTLINSGVLHDELSTPLITHTPTDPPALNRQIHSNTPAEYRFPPVSPPHPLIEQIKQPNRSKKPGQLSQSLDASILMINRNDSFDHTSIQPPPAPPFAPGKKGSPIQTPPRLTSPLILNGISPETPGSITDTLSQVSLGDDSLTNTIQTTYHKQPFPEELQESNSLDAYLDGPRNVLNNQIFLYSDPFTSKRRVDINNYNLVINVAKECNDMSAYYINPIPRKREYLFLPWLHTSPISKDLSKITTKIDSFYNKGYKILIHCQCGVSRSACVVVAYFMMKFTLGVNEAYELLKLGTNGNRQVCKNVKNTGNIIDGSDRICPNMSLIFELMEFGDSLCNKEVTTSALLFDSPSAMQI